MTISTRHSSEPREHEGGPSDDHALVARIKERLAGPLTVSRDLRVYCTDGQVTLAGVVDVLAEKLEAEKIVRQTPGVRKVENGITVSMDGQLTDDEIEQDLARRLGKVPGPKVGAEIEKGAVTLVGQVESLAQAQAAYRAATETPGVKAVESRLDLAGPSVDDATIASAVERDLANSTVGAAYIDTRVVDGVVELAGWVDDEEELRKIEAMIAEIPGVRDLRTKLLLRSEYRGGSPEWPEFDDETRG